MFTNLKRQWYLVTAPILMIVVTLIMTAARTPEAVPLAQVRQCTTGDWVCLNAKIDEVLLVAQSAQYGMTSVSKGLSDTNQALNQARAELAAERVARETLAERLRQVEVIQPGPYRDRLWSLAGDRAEAAERSRLNFSDPRRQLQTRYQIELALCRYAVNAGNPYQCPPSLPAELGGP